MSTRSTQDYQGPEGGGGTAFNVTGALIWLLMAVVVVGIGSWLAWPYLYPAAPLVTSGEIVYSRGVEPEGAGELTFRVYVMATNGITRPLIADEEGESVYADVSAGGNVVFSAKRNGDTQFELYVLTPGNDEVRLTDTVGSEIGPKWSPDGKQIAYTVEDDESDRPFTAWVMNADGTGAHEVNPGELLSLDPSWSPDGSTIIFTAGGNGIGAALFLSTDGVVTQLTPYDWGFQRAAVYSTDGTKIIFQFRTPIGWQLVSMNTDTTEVAVLTTQGQNGGAYCTPDGKIYFQSGRTGSLDLYVMNMDGSEQTAVTDTADEYEVGPVLVK